MSLSRHSIVGHTVPKIFLSEALSFLRSFGSLGNSFMIASGDLIGDLISEYNLERLSRELTSIGSGSDRITQLDLIRLS